MGCGWCVGVCQVEMAQNGANLGLWCVANNCTNANKWRRVDKMRALWLWCARGVSLCGRGISCACGVVFAPRVACALLGLARVLCVWSTVARLVLRWCGSDALVLFNRAP